MIRSPKEAEDTLARPSGSYGMAGRWSTLQNGDLLRVAERNGFDVMITADENITYQQNNSNRRIALIVLSATKWKLVAKSAPEIAAAVARCGAGTYEHISLAPEPSHSRSE